MFQKRGQETPGSDDDPREERAYEDNWYRSLKALSEQREDGSAGSTDGPAETAREERVEAHVEGSPEDAVVEGQVEDAVVEGQVEAATQDLAVHPDASPEATEASPPGADRERALSEEFEARAGQLLERLRKLQHLAER